MNTRQPIQTSATPNVLSISYSTSGKRLIVGLSDGVRVFRTDNCLTTTQPGLPFGLGASIAEALDDRYIAFVHSHRTAAGSPSIVIFWDCILEVELSRLDFHEPVLGLRLSSKWMAVILEERTIIFQYQEIQRRRQSATQESTSDTDDVEISNEKQTPCYAPNLTHSLYATAANTFGLAALSHDTLALPAQTGGQVQLITLKQGTSNTKRVLRAHNSSLRCLALSTDAALLATASEQGTLIRVFNTTTLDQVIEHRRGMDHAIIHDLAFSPHNGWVASTSDKGTLHVFNLRPQESSETTSTVRDREAKQRTHRKSQSYASHRLSAPAYDQDSVSGISAGRSSPSPSTAIGGGPGTAYQGSVQEYYGLRPPPASASPPARDAAVSAMAALRSSPLAPRILKDSRSVASAPFYIGHDPPHWQGGTPYSWTTIPNGTRKRVKNSVLPLANDPSGRPPKGRLVFAPRSEEAGDADGAILYVVGGGADGRWEMFELLPVSSNDGAGTKWGLVNRGFRKYLTRQFAD